MKGKKTHPSGRAWWREYRMTCLVLAAAVAVFIAARLIAVPAASGNSEPEEYAEYENGVITQILADNTVTDPTSDGAARGEQLLLVDVKTGQYAGETLLTTLLVCAYITVVTLTILGGFRRKTVCAMVGTLAGVALAMVFGLAAQALLQVDGLRLSDVEPLLQLRQTGTPIGLRGLLVAGVVISALGAVMDVAMSISSALSEVHAVAPERGWKDLVRSGMNIGRDMVGTMTNTLILAFLGSGLTLIIYLYSLGLDPHQLISSAYLATEAVSSIASSIGVILAVPLTAVFTALILDRKKKA